MSVRVSERPISNDSGRGREREGLAEGDSNPNDFPAEVSVSNLSV